MQIKLRVILIILIVLSLFVGVSVNGSWWFLYGQEVGYIPLISHSRATLAEIVAWGILIASHGIICSFPFWKPRRAFRIALIIAPVIFVLCFSLLIIVYIILLIPFIICWIVALIVTYREYFPNARLRPVEG